jgi:hypothetical protein
MKFFKAYSTKNVSKENAPYPSTAHFMMDILRDHQYPWRVALQQSSLPFANGAAKLTLQSYIYNLS